jgi:hypothetical protein
VTIAIPTAVTVAIEAETVGTVIVSLMETGVEAATETTAGETEAVLVQAKVLTQMKTVIGPAAAARATAVEVVEAVTVEATSIVVEVVRVPAPLAIEATIGTATGPATAAATVVKSAATAVATPPRLSPRLPKTTATSAPSSSSRSLSALRLAICALSSSALALSSKLRSSRTELPAAPRGKHLLHSHADQYANIPSSVGYVEFKDEASVPQALELTGQKLKGVPIIAQLTEAEKNRAARPSEGGAAPGANGAPFHRLYVGNIHFSVTEKDLQEIFEPFGELEQVILQRDEMNPGRSKGYGFVQ